jgi:hypothetical protein
MAFDEICGGCWERSPLLGFAVQRDEGDLGWRRICFAYGSRISGGVPYILWRGAGGGGGVAAAYGRRNRIAIAGLSAVSESESVRKGGDGCEGLDWELGLAG